MLNYYLGLYTHTYNNYKTADQNTLKLKYIIPKKNNKRNRINNLGSNYLSHTGWKYEA